jgi:undecaprenyl diphosphate synthase
MRLIGRHLRKESDFYRENDIRVVHSGEMSRLPKGIQGEIRSVMEETKGHGGMTLNLAINYGGRDEIVRAVNRWLASQSADSGERPELTERDLQQCLDCSQFPDPDLIIRTAGEQRVSNFLLWEAAYAELYFSPKLWPDFGPEDLLEAISAYQRRGRTYGAVPVEAR